MSTCRSVPLYIYTAIPAQIYLYLYTPYTVCTENSAERGPYTPLQHLSNPQETEDRIYCTGLVQHCTTVAYFEDVHPHPYHAHYRSTRNTHLVCMYSILQSPGIFIYPYAHAVVHTWPCLETRQSANRTITTPPALQNQKKIKIKIKTHMYTPYIRNTYTKQK